MTDFTSEYRRWVQLYELVELYIHLQLGLQGVMISHTHDYSVFAINFFVSLIVLPCILKLFLIPPTNAHKYLLQ